MTSTSTTHWWVPDHSMQVLLNPSCSWHLVQGELPSLSTWMTHRSWLLCFTKLIHHPPSGPSQGTLPLLYSPLRLKECLWKYATNLRESFWAHFPLVSHYCSVASLLSHFLSLFWIWLPFVYVVWLQNYVIFRLLSHSGIRYRLNSYHCSPDPNC